MADPPSGTVTFLFTDIEGSTELVKQLRERYAEALAVHQSLLREAFECHGGHEVDTQGDSFFVAFAAARDAILAALDSQRALAQQDWPGGAQLRVRMGIHTGQAAPSNGRYTGLGVHRAARICAAGHGGQVLVSQSTEALVQDDEEELGIRLRDLGEQQLKDLDRPVRLYPLEAPELEREFPPLRTVDQGRRRRAILISAGVLATVGAVAGGLLATRSGGGSGLTAKPNSVAVIDARSNSLLRVTPVGQTPTSIAIGEGAVWVLNSDEQTVSRLNPRTGARLRTDPVPAGATELAAGAHGLWVATNHGTVTQFDPQSGFKTQTLRLPILPGPATSSATQVAADAGSVWAGGPGVVARLAPPLRKHAADPLCCGGLAIGSDAVWATDEQGVVRIDPRTGTRDGHVHLSFLGNHIAAGSGAVWVANQGGDQLWRIDPRARQVDYAITVGDHPAGVAVGEGAVWVASPDGTVARVDPVTDKVVKQIRVGGTPNSIAVGNGKVWVTVD
jgi:class 3 adenylate cyclase/streptogramin lyase